MDWNHLSQCALARTPGALLLNAVCGGLGYASGAIDADGWIAGLALGTILTIGAGWTAFGLMALFVLLGSAATRFGGATKRRRGIAQANGGRRGAAHATANLCVPAVAAIALAVTRDQRWAVAVVAALATALADTLGTEVGKAIGMHPISPWTFRPATPGTPGAVSWQGSAAGLAGALLLGAVAVRYGLLSRWHLGAAAVAAACLAAWLESLIGSLPHCRRLLGNHGTNLLNTVIGAALGFLLAGVL